MKLNKYQIIYSDPCWDYKGQTQHGDGYDLRELLPPPPIQPPIGGFY